MLRGLHMRILLAGGSLMYREAEREYWLADLMHPCGKCHHAGDCFCYEEPEEVEEDMFCWIMLPVEYTCYQIEYPDIWMSVVDACNLFRSICPPE